MQISRRLLLTVVIRVADLCNLVSRGRIPRRKKTIYFDIFRISCWNMISSELVNKQPSLGITVIFFFGIWSFQLCSKGIPPLKLYTFVSSRGLICCFCVLLKISKTNNPVLETPRTKKKTRKKNTGEDKYVVHGWAEYRSMLAV